MSNGAIYHIHTLALHRKSAIGIIFGQRDGPDIVDKQDNETNRALDHKGSDLHLYDDNYDSKQGAKYDQSIDMSIRGVYPNNPIRNNP